MSIHSFKLIQPIVADISVQRKVLHWPLTLPSLKLHRYHGSKALLIGWSIGCAHDTLPLCWVKRPLIKMILSNLVMPSQRRGRHSPSPLTSSHKHPSFVPAVSEVLSSKPPFTHTHTHTHTHHDRPRALNYTFSLGHIIECIAHTST